MQRYKNYLDKTKEITLNLATISKELARTGKAEKRFRTFAVSKGIKGSAQARGELEQRELTKLFNH